MQPRTLAALAVSTGLVLGTAVLAIGATLMPSSASSRPHVRLAADVASDPGTTIVTDVQTVYDDPPAAAQPAPESAAAPESEPRSSDSDAPPALAPVVTTASPTPLAPSTEPSDGEHEYESSSSGGSFGD